jgi:enoyl-CoA hydratase
MSDAVLTEQRDRVLLITLNRPEAMNAMNAMNAINGALSHGLMDAVTRLNDDRA